MRASVSEIRKSTSTARFDAEWKSCRAEFVTACRFDWSYRSDAPSFDAVAGVSTEPGVLQVSVLILIKHIFIQQSTRYYQGFGGGILASIPL